MSFCSFSVPLPESSVSTPFSLCSRTPLKVPPCNFPVSLSISYTQTHVDIICMYVCFYKYSVKWCFWFLGKLWESERKLRFWILGLF